MTPGVRRTLYTVAAILPWLLVGGALGMLLAVMLFGLAGCTGQPREDGNSAVGLHKDEDGHVSMHAANATNAVCDATANAYFNDAIRSNATGKALLDLAYKPGVAKGVTSAVDNLFDDAGNAPELDSEMNAAYNLVIERCRKEGWS